MIEFHGGPITPLSVARAVLKGRFALVSFYNPIQVELAFELCRGVMLDCGEFSFWAAAKRGQPIVWPVSDWRPYYRWVGVWRYHPRFVGAIIPDRIDGSEEDNDALLREWPHGPVVGIPVWHLNESPKRLVRLASEYPRVALGSCGEYDVSSPKRCIARLRDVLPLICNEHGYPRAKLHGFRMLAPEIRAEIPLAGADSSTLARNIGPDKYWPRGPRGKTARAHVILDRLESAPTATTLTHRPPPAGQEELF